MFLGHSYKATPTVCDAALHRRGLSGLYAACGYTTQRHRLLVWKPQSHRHGEIHT